MNITICQFYTNNISYGEFTEKINKSYCELHGYNYYVEKNENLINSKLEGRSPTWYKPHLILDVFEKFNSDYVIFLDIDAVIHNQKIKIENFIRDYDNITCTVDYGPSLINAGVFIFKNNNTVKNFLKSWWEYGNVYPEYKTGLWHDQTCFGLLYNECGIKNTINIVKDPSLLNGREYNENGFIFHAFSYGMLKNRTIDKIYYKLFNIEPPILEHQDKTLKDICVNYNTDKHYEHNYFNLIYDEVLSPLKNKVKNFLEIGVKDGNSISLWRDYFINAHIFGLDINLDNVIINNERITLLQCDQSKYDDLNNLKLPKLDIILDDGSHKMLDQQISLAALFKRLKSGGIYILEDLHTSLEAVLPEKEWCGWGDPNKTITLNMLNNFINTGIIQSDYLSKNDINYLQQNIESIKIYKNQPNWSITSIIRKK